MQDKYVGDIGDFGKYSLLNYLQSKSGLKLGIVWYLTNPQHTDLQHQAKDGKHIRYLGLDISDDGQIVEAKPTQDGLVLKGLDGALYAKLRSIVQKNRSIYSIEKNQIINIGTIFFSEEISLGRKLSSKNRKEARHTWLSKAMLATEQAGILFLDPDNGLAKSSRSGSRTTDAKYVLQNELKNFWGNGTRTIVLYHHPDHSREHDSQIADHAKAIKIMLNKSTVYPIRYRRGTSRVYFVITSEHDSKKWSKYLLDFSNWDWPFNEKSGRAFEFFPIT